MIAYEIDKSIVLSAKKKKGEVLTESEEIDLVLCLKKIRSRAISNIFYDFIDDEKLLKENSEFENIIFDIIDDIQKYNEEKFGIRNKNKGLDKNNIIKKLKEKSIIDKKIPPIGKDEIMIIEKVIKEFFELEKRDYLVSEGGMIDHDFLKNGVLNYLCPKIVAIIVNILRNFNTKQVVFSFFINKNGLLFIHNILKICNVTTEIYSGEVSAKSRQKILDKFNSEENRYGKIIKVLLVTEAGCEGITMLEVENVHFLETNPNANKSLQCVGRAARFRSHINMPPERKKVNIWRYYATPTSYEIDYSGLKNFSNYYNYYIKENNSRFNQKGLRMGIDEMLDLQNKENIVDYKKFYDILQKYSIENTGLINIIKKSNIDIVRDIFKNYKEDNISKKELRKILKKMGIKIEKDKLNEIINKLQDE
jgi:superfamily II DNA/RNA helicase